ncbi:MAG: UDP-N-acetylmuramate--L-alanine ligase [Acidobacteria bacterium 13_1_40CM_2_64_6]|nr:MAG: UDP-N-acetylmuramate--L-alanine ligase [Acidobacteria bacterium 13_1_40CM_4_65_8]OLD55801.1 MAG: UDP-N-acetylmuramate--L-alanine ligase [Acidobacteria bacterium 13_1_40CM_2_64_6]
MLGKTRRVHFIGIGGIGMSGIAELLANLGFVVSGSDMKRSAVTDRLETLGIRVAVGHDAAHVGEADVVVVSSAVRSSNAEVIEAARRQIPVIPRAEMLAELMRLRFAIAVAGAHGKTTTTSMIALVLERAGLDPTAVIGGRLSAFGSNARLGKGEHLVAEADESDRSFLKLFPTIAVITNIDHEHLENYGGFDDLLQAFVDFANKVPFYGGVVACLDDPNLAGILPRMTRRVTTYGLNSADADLIATDVELGPLSAKATVKRRDRRERGSTRRPAQGSRQAGGSDPQQTHASLGTLSLAVPGRHNLQNALAAVAVGMELGLRFDRVAEGLRDFRGAERRFDVKGEPNGILVVDDYGHHPTEIAAVLAAARTLNRRVVVAFQPHRYTRTASLMDAFGPALSGADHIVLTDIYPANEDPIPGVTLDTLASAIRRSVTVPLDVAPKLDDVVAAIARIAKPGDVVITLGAGSIGSVPDRLLEVLKS